MKLAHRAACLLLTAAACGSGGGDTDSAGNAQPAAAESHRLPRRLWTLAPAADVYDVSPDGRYAAYIDWDTGNLMLRDLETGSVRNLTNKGTYKHSSDEAESALFSPDGKWVAYEWWNQKDQRDELRIAASDGSTIKRLNVPAGYSIWPEEWTPDSKYVIVLLDPCATCQGGRPNETSRTVVLVALDGGEARPLLKHENARGAGWLRISPDGRFAAYAPAPQSGRVNRIELIDMNTRRQTTLFEESARPLPIGWIDPSTLLFASERGGTNGVWSLTVENGRAKGEPRLVRGDLWNMTDMQRLRGNRLFYDAVAGNRDILVAGFDPMTGRLLSQPASLTRHPGLDYRTPAWSPDGKYIAYQIFRPALPATIVVRSADGGDVREFRPEQPGLSQLTWLPDGQSLMLVVNDQGRHSLYRYDLNSRAMNLEVKFTYPVVSYSRDGRYMYYVPRPLGAPEIRRRLMSRDLETGQERELGRAPEGLSVNAFNVVDGRIALLTVMGKHSPGVPTEAWSISLTDGSVQNRGATIATDSTQWMRPIGSTTDGKQHLFLTGRLADDFLSGLWRLPLEGGAAVRLVDPPKIIRGAQGPAPLISPDGRRLMYVTGDLKTELWSIDLDVPR